ncbi:MAG: MATE family efflux transporter [Opitutales bacterium]|nr:MATE family efflux transporter [Opitutales bacterium]
MQENSQHVKDLGTHSIGMLMLRYSIPTILAMTIHATYNVVDRIFVGRICGEDALAAITVCFSPTLFFLAISMTIGHGSAAILSISLGKKDIRSAEKILSQCIFLFAFFYLIVLCLMSLYMRDVLMMFGATDKIIDDACKYYRIIVAGLIFEKLSGGMSHVIRAEGRPAYAMATIFISCWMNIVFDYIFLFIFEMGGVGAALANVISQAIGVIWVICFYFSGRSCLRIRLRDLRVHKGLFTSMCSAGSPSLIMQIFASLGVALYIMQAREYGNEAIIAVVGIAMAITTFMFLPIVGLSAGMQPIIGFNWGAKNMPRVYKTLIYGIIVATFICVVGFTIGELFPNYLYIMFLGKESNLIPVGEKVLRILILCYPFIGVNIVTSGFFQSTKRPVYAIIVTIMRQGVFLIPLLYILPKYWGLDGLWYSFPLSDFAAFVITLFFIWIVIFNKNKKNI